MAISGSTYPTGGEWGRYSQQGVMLPPGLPASNSGPPPGGKEDPSSKTAAVFSMMPFWDPINLCIGGTKAIRANAEQIIPREPEEPDDAYQRRIFHAVMPPFLNRLAAQAAGTILRKGIHLEGGDEEFWTEWAKDVTGDGTPLNEFARRLLVNSLLFGHDSVLVDYPDASTAPRTLAEEQSLKDRKPYLVPINAQQILGWRTEGNRAMGKLRQVRYMEMVCETEGPFGESLVEQIRVLEPGTWQLWRRDEAASTGWSLYKSGETTIDEIPLQTVYSNRLGTLLSRPPLLEVAYLNLSYAQRFTDYHFAIHVGASPILILKGFDQDTGKPVGLSVNTAVLLPPDGDGYYVEPRSDAFDAQLKCLQTLEEQISSLGINTLAKQNITNAAAEAKRLDRIDSDSIMSIISEDLARAIESVVKIAGEYAGVEPPTVTIPKDYENRLLDGNQITAYLQLYMQGAISQETLLRILQEGEVLPVYIDLEEEMVATKELLEEQMAMDLQRLDAEAKVAAEHAPEPAGPGGATSGKASGGSSKGSQTLATPMRPGKHKA
jgi:hypothetical protein